MMEAAIKYQKSVEKHVIIRKIYDNAMAEMWKVFFHIHFRSVLQENSVK